MSRKLAKPNSPLQNAGDIVPAISPKAREDRCIDLAYDLVEQRMRDGTASSQETTHFLKLAATKNELEIRKAEAEIKLAEAKIKEIDDRASNKELYEQAILAMQSYSPTGGNN